MKKLNLGCGMNLLEGYENHDWLDFPNLAHRFDLEKPPYPLKDNTFDEIYSHTVFEHIRNFIPMVLECHRILKPNGLLIIEAPYYRGPGAMTTIGHVNSFNEDTMNIFEKEVYHIDPKRTRPYFLVKRIQMKFGRFAPIQWFLWKSQIFWCGGEIHYELRKTYWSL